jgi:hypothetical protein
MILLSKTLGIDKKVVWVGKGNPGALQFDELGEANSEARPSQV